MSNVQRKLTVILSADVVGYSALMERDEDGTLARLKALQSETIGPAVGAHGGRVFKLLGDGILAEFPSASSAVSFALQVQQAIGSGTGELQYRIGINLGDVIVEGEDIYGDGVNVAARLQSLAPPGGIAVSRIVSDQVHGKINAEFEDLGEHTVKNIERPVHVFSVRAASPADKAGEPSAASRRQRVSICVLPFSNMSGESEQEYFSDGISEDIITDLSKVSAIWVASRNTSFTFKGKNVNVANVARQLNVAHILEGSVRKAGGRVRITAQLLDASGGHVWAERYDRDLHDIFALQDEISQAVVSALKIKLLPEEKQAIERRDATNPEAYELFLLARKFDRNGAERTKPLIVRICRKAVELDPGFARAWALMALAEAEATQRQVPGFSFDGARQSAERAIEFDPSLAEGYAALAEVYFRRRGWAADGSPEDVDLASAHEANERALLLDPNCYEAHLFAGYISLGDKDYRKAIVHFERAAALDENAHRPLGMVLQAYEQLGEIEPAKDAARRCLARCERILAVEPDSGNALGFFVSSLATLGEAERVRDWAKKAMLLDPDNLRLQYNVACSLAEQGDADLALDILDGVVPKVYGGWIGWMAVDTSLDPIREHPRFTALMTAARARLETEPHT